MRGARTEWARRCPRVLRLTPVSVPRREHDEIDGDAAAAATDSGRSSDSDSDDENQARAVIGLWDLLDQNKRRDRLFRLPDDSLTAFACAPPPSS